MDVQELSQEVAFCRRIATEIAEAGSCTLAFRDLAQFGYVGKWRPGLEAFADRHGWALDLDTTSERVRLRRIDARTRVVSIWRRRESSGLCVCSGGSVTHE